MICRTLELDDSEVWRCGLCSEAADGEIVSVGFRLVSRIVAWFGAGSHSVVGVVYEVTCGREGPPVFATHKVCCEVRFCCVLLFVSEFSRRSRMHQFCDLLVRRDCSAS